MSNNNRVVAGVVVGVVAIAIAIYAIGNNDGDSVACDLAPASAGLLISGLSHHETAGTLIAGVGAGVGVSKACKAAIKRWAEEPDAPATLKVDTDSGAVGEEVTGNDLATRPPPSQVQQTVQQTQPSVDIARIIDCARWNAQFLIDACVEHTIEPPAA